MAFVVRVIILLLFRRLWHLGLGGSGILLYSSGGSGILIRSALASYCGRAALTSWLGMATESCLEWMAMSSRCMTIGSDFMAIEGCRHGLGILIKAGLRHLVKYYILADSLLLIDSDSLVHCLVRKYPDVH